MAILRLDNIRPEILTWAFCRAGYSKEEAIIAFPKLESWLEKKEKPTVNQLKVFASKFFIPFGYLFLQQVPKETIPFPMFRGESGKSNHFDLNVYDTILNIQGRQEWLEDYMNDNDIDSCELVESIDLSTPIGTAVDKLRVSLGLNNHWAFSLKTVETALGLLTERLEDTGIFVAFNGVVGNNTHRKLKVSECRGFALVNKTAPYIFINSADSKYAQMFTMIHETAHIMLGISAGHAGDDFFNHDQVESYCDKVAAEFLVPAESIREVWKGDIKNTSRKFKVSEIVIARRAHDIGVLSDEEYKRFWFAYKSRPIVQQKEKSGGDFYLTSVKRVGKLFAIHVRNAVNNRKLSYTDAYRLTGLYGSTYQHFMNNNI